jgi:hypothetical protein
MVRRSDCDYLYFQGSVVSYEKINDRLITDRIAGADAFKGFVF